MYIIFYVLLDLLYIVDFLKESARVSQVQVSLDRAQDEIQLMKLSISEKETQLLQSQDQYLWVL